VQKAKRRQRRTLNEGEERSLEELMEDMSFTESGSRDQLTLTIEHHIQQSDYISMERPQPIEVQQAQILFENYASQLRHVCMALSLSQTRLAMLTEQEVMVGTIIAKSSQPRKRQDLMSKVLGFDYSLVSPH
jgi:RNA-dependent RNA polymerase